MKRCPACQRAYADTNTFCIEDGTVLLADSVHASDNPPSSGRYEPPPTELFIPPTEVYKPSPPASSGSGGYNPSAAPPYTPPQPPSGYGAGPGSWSNPPANYTPPPVPQPGYGPGPSPWSNPPANYAPPLHPSLPSSGGQDQSFAVAALVCGALSFVCFGPLLGIPAIILGTIGRKRALTEPQRYTGQGLALAGIILGGLNLALVGLYILILILGSL